MKKFKFRDLMVFIVLSAAVAIAYQVPYIRYTFYDQMTVALGLSNTQLGIIATVVSLVSTICYPIGGVLADKFSMRTLVNISVGAFVLLDVWYAFTTNYVMLIIIHVLYGFFGIATLWSAYLVGIRNLGDAGNQSTLFGSSEATRGIIQTICGFVVLAIMGGALSGITLNLAAPTAEMTVAVQSGWRTMLLAAAAITAIFFVLGLVFLPKSKKGQKDQAPAGEEPVPEQPIKKYTFKDVAKNKGVWISIVVIMCAYMLWSLGNGYLTTYTVQILNIDAQTASTLGIVRSYIIVFVAGFCGFIVDRVNYKGAAFMGMFVLAIALLLGVMFSTAVVPLCVALTLVIAFFANVMKSTYWSILGQAGIPVAMTALATGFISFIAFIPEFIAPTVCGVWLDAAVAAGTPIVGFYKIFIMLIVFAIIGVVFSLVLMRRTKKLESEGLVETRKSMKAAECVNGDGSV
ncbi:MAG: MFS transporter [Coriobacteriales bacterium]|nr:MFS transporter [Coriobacteriales bacterium]